mmetsp:Transcript_26797/g.63909  ORF Transcript_26797/g.63909 Transcript_26797/m.63909 type:complete len:101 (+) Transcript_26797:460-762(+)
MLAVPPILPHNKEARWRRRFPVWSQLLPLSIVNTFGDVCSFCQGVIAQKIGLSVTKYELRRLFKEDADGGLQQKRGLSPIFALTSDGDVRISLALVGRRS